MQEEKSLKEILGDDAKSRGCTFAETVSALFAYFFHRISQAEFIKYLQAQDGNKDRAKRIIAKTRDKGYVLKNCKTYAYAYYLYNIGKGGRPLARAFEIAPADARVLKRLQMNHLPVKHLHKSWVVRQGQGAWHPYMMDSMLQETLFTQKFDQYIGKFISKKMTFLIKSYGERRDDLVKEMQAAAVRVVYMTYPRFDSLLHMENTMKTAIKNAGQSKILYHTTESRNMLYKDEQGMHQSVFTGVHELETQVSPDGYLHHIKESLQCLASLESEMGPGARRFITLACGHYDKEFSEFLKSDNSAAVDLMSYDRYLSYVRKFLGERLGLSPDSINQKVADMFSALRSYV